MSVVDYVDSLLAQASQIGASDIHCEPTDTGLRVRLRIDGLLVHYIDIDHDLMAQVLTRLKVLASMDVAQKRLPQDGTFSLATSAGPRDLRVCSFPSQYGEKIVVRILERNAVAMPLAQLGLSDDMLKELGALTQKASGFFLVAGPTGSGKTTTLYSMLSALNTADRNIVTLEDPIEYTLPGITQSQIHEEIGFTFARGIRSLLRQDPDVIMVGEIRDKETAQVAIQAALTGHMVISTIHTHDTVGAIMRLLDMGIPAYLINATLSGVLSQRLVRLLCTVCQATERNGKGPPMCDACNNQGYKGRTGIFELLTLSDELRELLTTEPSYRGLKQYIMQTSVKTLDMDAKHKVKAGLTSNKECLRVLC